MDPSNPSVSVLGKLPSRADFVEYGLVDEPERVFRAWLEQAVLVADGVLPNRAVRFVVAPRRTPMFGIWIPSHDALGRAFPLVFLRRLSNSENGNRRASGSHALRVLGDLPWTLILAGCANYLTTAESCLMLGRSDSAAGLWARLEALPLPSQRDLLELWGEATRSMESEQLDTFAARNLSVAANGEEFLSALRRLGPSLQARVNGSGAAQDDGSMLAVPAAHEFDMFAWLELLRVQRDPGMTPRSLFWSPADRRALVSLGAPLPGTLAFLRQPRVNSVQRLPLVNEPDESPAIESELRRLVRRCLTLSKLRSALSGDRHDAGRPPPLPKKEQQPTTETKQPRAPQKEAAPHDPHTAAPHNSHPAAPKPQAPAPTPVVPRDSWYDAEPQPLEKFRNGPAPRSHFPCGEYPPDLAKRFAPEPAIAEQPRRPAHAPPTEPRSGSFDREPPSTQPSAKAQAQRPIRFRIPDPPVNLSDTDAIEYVFALVRERERAEEEHERAERRRERIDADKTVTERAQADQECAGSQRVVPHDPFPHEHDRAEQECARSQRLDPQDASPHQRDPAHHDARDTQRVHPHDALAHERDPAHPGYADLQRLDPRDASLHQRDHARHEGADSQRLDPQDASPHRRDRAHHGYADSQRLDAHAALAHERDHAHHEYADSQRLDAHAAFAHEHGRVERQLGSAELSLAAHLRDDERHPALHERHPALHERELTQQEHSAAERASTRGERHDLHRTLRSQTASRTAHVELEEHLLERERQFTRREHALEEREREVRRREVALHSRERQLRERERAVRHGERARRISQTFEITERPAAAVRVLEPITVVQGRSVSAARGLVSEPTRLDPPRSTVQHLRSCTRVLEPITLVDDGSIRAARVLMIE